MTMRRFSWLVVAYSLAAAPLAAGIRLTGSVYTQDTTKAVTVRVFARGEAVVSGRTPFEKALAEQSVAPGGTFSFVLDHAELPLRVEASAPGHVAAGFDVVFPEQTALPAAWLPHGEERVLRVVADGKPAAGAIIWGELVTAFGGDGQRRWTPCIPLSVADEKGTVRLVAGANDSLRAVGRDAEGRWGSVGEIAPALGMKDLVLDSWAVKVRVVDERARPLAGIRVAAAGGPAGSAVVTDEDGEADVMVRTAKAWSIVALDGSRLGRTLRSGPAPADGVVVAAEPFTPLEVTWAGAPTTLALEPSWFPPALSGDAPTLASGGRARLPFWGTRGELTAFAPGIETASESVLGVRQGLVLRLRAAVSVEGTVVGNDDAALTGVPVWSLTLPSFMRTGHVRGMSRRAMMQPSALPVAVSGASGRFTVTDLPSGPLGLEARLTGFPPASSPDLDAKPGSTQRVTLKLVPGRVVTLVAVDTGGQALAGVVAQAFTDPSAGEGGGTRTVIRIGGIGEDERPVASSASDEEGRLQIAGVPQGGIRVELTRSGYAKRWAKGVVTERGLDLGEQVMEPGVDVAGRVVDDSDSGVGDIDVFIDLLGMGRTMRPDARSDPQGYFVIADQPRSGSLALSARGEGWASAAPTRFTLPPDGLITIRVHRERALEGRVVDRDSGEAVPGASVSAVKRVERSVGGRAQFMVGQFIGSAEAGDDGRFRVDGVQPGPIDLSVSAEGYRDRRLEVDVPSDGEPEPVTIVVERGLTIRGRVVETSGGPAGGVEISAVAAAQGGSMIRMGGRMGVRSGPDGRFEVNGLAPGRYDVTATGERGERAREVADAGAEDVVLRLEPPGTLRGTVRTAEGAVPPRCRIQAVGGGAGAAEADADAGGAFAIEDLAPGSYNVVASAEGYAPALKNVTIEAGATATVELELEAGGTINGRVLGLSQDELQRCRIYGGGAGSQPNGDGTFALRGVRIGRVQVTASIFPDGRERSATVEVSDVAVPAEVEIDFAGGLSVAGTVTRAGRPASGLAVVAATTGRGQAGMTTTDETGRFELKGLDPGEIDISVQDDRGRTLVARRLTLTADTRVDLEVAGGSLAGRVVVAGEGTPVMEAGVEALLQGEAPLSRRAQSDDAGAFVLADLPDGTYTVRASAPGYATAETTAALSMGEGPELRLELTAEQVLELLVREPDGRIPDRVFVLPMRGGRVEDPVWAPLDRQGRARITSLPTGDTTLLVNGAGAAVVRVMVPSEGNAVQLVPTGRLMVVTPVAEGGAPARVRVATAGGLVVPASPWRSPARDGWMETDGGSLTVSLPAGAYIVEMIGPDGGHRSTTATVTPGGTATATFEE